MSQRINVPTRFDLCFQSLPIYLLTNLMIAHKSLFYRRNAYMIRKCQIFKVVARVNSRTFEVGSLRVFRTPASICMVSLQHHVTVGLNDADSPNMIDMRARSINQMAINQ